MFTLLLHCHVRSTSPILPSLMNLLMRTRQKELPSFEPAIKKPPFAARFGMAMKRHAQWITLIQWGMVGVYLFLLFAPLVFPDYADIPFSWTRLQLLAVFLFWGVGWPLIMLSTMVFGRIWCGIFCPDGTLTEAISHHGQKRSIPRWIRWPGWPCLSFTLYTLCLFLCGAFHQHAASAVMLGTLSLAAMLTGFLYANGKRVWCMYLCPSNALFSFLARLAPFSFQVDPAKWEAYQGPAERINCATLINIKQMKSAALCHACGRCSGYRDAVELTVRNPGHEILSGISKPTTLQALTLLFGIIGLGTASLFFSQNAFEPDPLSLASLVVGCAMALGGFLWGMMRLSCRIIPSVLLSWQQLSLGLIPLAGMGLFLGFVRFTLPITGIWQGMIMQALLAAAFLFSLWLGYRLVFRETRLRHVMAFAMYAIALGTLGLIWISVISA